MYQREFSLQDLSPFFFSCLAKTVAAPRQPSPQCHWHDSPKIHPYLQQSETSSKTSKTSKFRLPIASGLTLFASLSWNIFSRSHISLILLFGFAVWVKDRHACKNYILAHGSQMAWVTTKFSQLPLHRRARQLSVI